MTIAKLFALNANAIRKTCENYSKLKVPYKHQKIIHELSRNTDIIILRQDEGRGVTISDR